MDVDLERSLKLPVNHGALVQDITNGSPADRAGLRPYDVITSLDDRAIANDDQLIREIASRAPGSAARLHLLRDGHDQTLVVKLSERPARERPDKIDSPAGPPERSKADPDSLLLGLTVRDIDRATADRLELPKQMRGVLIARVEAMSSAFDSGIERGTVLLEINRQRVESAAEFRRIAHAARTGDVLTLYVYAPDLDQRQLKTIRVEDDRYTADNMPKSRILVIDDEAAIRDSLRMTLEYEGYEFLGAATGQEGLALAERDAPDLVLLDVKMPGMDGIEVLERLRNMNDALPVIVVSGHGTIQTAVEATKKGAFDFIEKPFASERVLVSLRNALDSRQLRDEVRTLKKAVEVRHQMIGDSPGLKQVMAAISRAAPTNATVLITGESGVGKELVARTIHRNSLRSRERFVQVNCAAIPEELIESELFGHEKGSFTGATEKQVGKFEQADRGTIFLDEVGDMSAKTQAKVLRVLQEGEVERLGSARTIKVDVRVIAATNKNLEEEIEKGQFREDLYFRLAVIPIQVPPLRERPDDVAPLVRHYMEYFSRENNVRPKRLTQAALDALSRYRWKGNIRELRNTVERLNIMTGGDVIDVADLPETVRSPAAWSGGSSVGGAASSKPGSEADQAKAAGTLREFKENAERMFLVGKLRENGWNISKTAEVIGTPRSNLYKKLEQYQITQESDG